MIDAKIWNERLKLSATYVNAWAIGLAVLAILRPVTEENVQGIGWLGLLASFALHAIARYILGGLREE